MPFSCLSSLNQLMRAALPGRFIIRRHLSRLLVLQGLEETKERSCLAYPGELDTKCLHLNEQVLDVDDLVANQRLEEHADQPHQPILHVFVLDVFAGRDAVRDVEVNESGRQIYSSSEAIH